MGGSEGVGAHSEPVGKQFINISLNGFLSRAYEIRRDGVENLEGESAAARVA